MTDLTRRVLRTGTIGGLIVVAGILAVAPTLIDAWKERNECIAAFHGYAAQLESKNYEAAWRSLGPRIQQNVGVAEFARMHLDLVTQFGELKSAHADNAVVEGNGNPISWVGNIQCTFQYERGTIRLRYELHKTAGAWRVHGFERQRE